MDELAQAIHRLSDILELMLIRSPKATYSVLVGAFKTRIVFAEGVKRVRIYNPDPALTVYLGTSNVSVSDGYPLPPGAADEFVLLPGADIYGITDGGTVEVRVIEL